MTWLHFRIIHHVNDAVEATLYVHNRPRKRILLQPLRGVDQTEAAERIETFLNKMNKALKLAIASQASRGPTHADD